MGLWLKFLKGRFTTPARRQRWVALCLEAEIGSAALPPHQHTANRPPRQPEPAAAAAPEGLKRFKRRSAAADERTELGQPRIRFGGPATTQLAGRDAGPPDAGTATTCRMPDQAFSSIADRLQVNSATLALAVEADAHRQGEAA